MGGQKNKVGGQKNKVGGSEKQGGGQKNKVGGQKNKVPFICIYKINHWDVSCFFPATCPGRLVAEENHAQSFFVT